MNNEPEGTNFECGVLVLLLASGLGIAVVALLPLTGMSVQTIEKGMVWASIPWVAYWYLKCRKWHRTKIVFEDEETNTAEPR
jgi:hypothetical protein